MCKTRLDVSLDQDLAEFAKVFAAQNRTSMANIVMRYLLALTRRFGGNISKRFSAILSFSRRWKMLRPNCVQEPHSKHG